MAATAHDYTNYSPRFDRTEEAVSANVAGFAYSYALTALLSALLVVAKEEIPAILTVMKLLTGHHWITHGIIDIVAFVILGLSLSRTEMAQTATARSLTWAIVGSTFLSGALIVGFYGF